MSDLLAVGLAEAPSPLPSLDTALWLDTLSWLPDRAAWRLCALTAEVLRRRGRLVLHGVDDTPDRRALERLLGWSWLPRSVAQVARMARTAGLAVTHQETEGPGWLLVLQPVTTQALTG